MNEFSFLATSGLCNVTKFGGQTIYAYAAAIMDPAHTLEPSTTAQMVAVGYDCAPGCSFCQIAATVPVGECHKSFATVQQGLHPYVPGKSKKKSKGTAIALGIVFGLIFPLALGGLAYWYFMVYKKRGASYQAI